jgi:hypothetical protein
MIGSITKRIVAAFALLAILGAPAAAQVPSPFARELARQLAQGEQVLAQHGYSRAAGPFAGGLEQRAQRRFPVTLRAGQDYRVLGVCDSRCGDLDMRLLDMNDAVIAVDNMTDDVPVLQIRPRATGVHTIEVTMYQCAATPCYFAFNVYALSE